VIAWQLRVVIKVPDTPDDPFKFEAHLAGSIVPQESTVQYLSVSDNQCACGE
jgi:hypothetical protein